MSCVGTIAAHRAAGVRVVLLFLTRGEMTESLGPLTAEEVAAQREQHGLEIGRMLDCEVRFLDFRDTRIEYTAAAAERVAREIADIRPGAVITWGNAWVRGMRHPDHSATGRIVRAAITLARMKRVVAPVEPHREVAAVFTLRDRHSTLPEAAIDVSAHLGPIRDVARYYRERVGWPEEDWLTRRLEAAGRNWGVRAAEVFDAWESEPGLRTSLLGGYLAP